MTESTPFTLTASMDDETGQTFFPARELSVDGRLRALRRVPLETAGVLHSFAKIGAVTYGLIDLPGGVRLQTELTEGEPQIGDSYRLTGTEDEWRFEHA